MEAVITLVALVMSVVFFVVTYEFPQLAADPGGPALFPRIAASITAIACLLFLIQYFLTCRLKSPGIGGLWAGSIATLTANRRKIASFALILLLPLAIGRIGFVYATFAFALLLMLLSRVGPVRSLLCALVVTAGVYVGYALLLGAVLPRGSWLT